MTMVAACRFKDGAVMISDSRVTWRERNERAFQDTLQKILPLGPKIAIGFAGSVQAANLVVQQLRRRMQKTERLRSLQKLAANVPRIAKHCYRLHQNRTGRKDPLSLVLGGVTGTGKIEIWYFRSPDFVRHKLDRDFVVVGSGDVVASFIKDNLKSIERKQVNLKKRADALLFGLEAELERQGIDTVGGLLQVILLDSRGIYPLKYGFLDLDLTSHGEAKSMEMEAGRWVQRDESTGQEVPLIQPSELLGRLPTELRFHDFHIPSDKSTPNWHLTCFLTCLEIQRDIGTIEFRGSMTNLASLRYPISESVLVYLDLWGSGGDHEVIFKLMREDVGEVIHREIIHIDYLVEGIEFIAKIPIHVLAPGPAFLECYIGDQLLGRRALYFGQAIDAWPSNDAELKELFLKNRKIMIEEQRCCLDPMLEDSENPHWSISRFAGSALTKNRF